MHFIQYLFFYVHLQLLLGNCNTITHSIKYSFHNTQKWEYLLYFVQKYSHKTQKSQHLTHFGPTPDMEWLIHYPKKGIFK